MEELDLLCKLERHHNSLKNYNIKLEDLKEIISVDKTRKEILDKERNLKELIVKKEEVKLQSRKIDKKFKEYDYKIKEVEGKLYSGDTGDITQLEKWNIEKNNIKDIINNTETEILEFMEETEEIEKISLLLEESLRKLKEEYEEHLIQYKKTEEDLNENIKMEIKSIKELEKTIDLTLLERYNLIRKNNVTAVAQIKEGNCSGCNTGVSTYILEEIKKKEEIIFCEFCGRILSKNSVT